MGLINTVLISPSGNEGSLTAPNILGLRCPKIPLKMMDFGVLPPKSELGKQRVGAAEVCANGGGGKGGERSPNWVKKGRF